MPQQIINIGAAPDDGTGDPLRNGGSKINANFTELYAADAQNLKKANNLSDVANAGTARTNLDVYSKAQVDAADALALKKASNLSDVANVATARTNLDVYSKAQVDAADALALAKANNLSDIANAGLARTNLGIIHGQLPVGWIEPTDYSESSWYRNDYGVRFWSNGFRVYPMLPYGGTTRSEWHDPDNIVETFPDTSVLYVAVDMAKAYDPTLQGVGYSTIHVDFLTGSDTTGDGSSGAPYKTVSKARTEAEADSGTHFEIVIHVDGAFIGNTCMGVGTRTLTKNYKFRNDDPSKLWIPGAREAYTKATFAWAYMGNGIWKSAVPTSTISASAKATAIVFDLSVLDSDGAPTPSQWLAGPYADEAAILAAMAAAGPSFHTDASGNQYVKLASGAEPNPGVNFGYTETGSLIQWGPGDGKMLMFEGFKLLHGTKTASIDAWRVRPSGVPGTLNSSTPYTNHQTRVVFRDCQAIGASGNGFKTEGNERAIFVNCRDFYNWRDGVNETNLYRYPTSSSGTTQGDNDHCFIDRHISKYHGPGNGQRDAPAVNASANCFTGHVRGRTTLINSIGRSSNGSSVAYVTGAKCLSIANNISGPKPVTPATDTYTAAFLASSTSAGVVEGARILSLFDAGYVRGADSATHYAGNGSKVAVEGFRGTITIEEVGTGEVVDGNGAAL